MSSSGGDIRRAPRRPDVPRGAGNACGKIAYHSRRDARLAMSQNQPGVQGMRAYRCDDCNLFHYGHLPAPVQRGHLGVDEFYATRRVAPRTPTDVERRVLNYLDEYVAAVGYPPSLREIRQSARLRGNGLVLAILDQLQAKGWIHRDPNATRAITLLWRKRPRPKSGGGRRVSAWTRREIRRSDPGGNTTGDTAGYVPKPRCRCDDLFAVHEVRKDRTRGVCSRSGCPCKVYEPEEGSDAA